MNEFDEQHEYIFSLQFRNQFPSGYLRSLLPIEKIAKLAQLQEQYYQILLIREQNGGRPIPEKWQKWHLARYENSKSS